MCVVSGLALVATLEEDEEDADDVDGLGFFFASATSVLSRLIALTTTLR